MEFTGERVVPDKMIADPITYIEHLVRYVFASVHCAGKSVLDAACGCGYGLQIMSAPAREIAGCDISQEAIDYAMSNFIFYKRPNRFACADFEKDSLADVFAGRKFDLITSFETIEHLADPDFFLRGARNALNDGGQFIFSIPNSNPSQFHKRVYTLSEAKELISKHFSSVTWFGQTLLDLTECDESKTFFIGVAKK
jgi:2-polyprenyl-3-methyl-5-hydroxy-6-metoxy-1,4-benzoquinol methylase